MTTLEQDTDELVKEYSFDHNEHYYGALASEDDDEKLIEMREVLMDFIEQGMSESFINKFHLLLEVERELTIREDR